MDYCIRLIRLGDQLGHYWNLQHGVGHREKVQLCVLRAAQDRIMRMCIVINLRRSCTEIDGQVHIY